MHYNWINAENYTMDTFLFFDRWIIRYIIAENPEYDLGSCDYTADMARALSRYPYVKAFCKRKAPECTEFLNKLSEIDVSGISEGEARSAETAILTELETFVVYAYPEVMEQVNYIRNWNEQRLFDLADFHGKTVLDIGAGTGRLTFAAAKQAKRVYASEPCDALREFMRDKIKKTNVTNVKVLDGDVVNLPYEDSTFDIVMSGHVVGDSYDEEIAEMTRVTKNGGLIICCNGDDEFKRTAPNKELVSRDFDFFSHESCEGGIIYDYKKKVIK